MPIEKPAELIPDDRVALFDYLRGGKHQPDQVAEKLGAQLGNRARAYDLVTEALTMIEDERQIIRHRVALTAALSAAVAAVDRATAELGKLSDPVLYDVEYAEGGKRVNDLEWLLNDAGRSLRTACIINPCPTEPGDDQR